MIISIALLCFSFLLSTFLGSVPVHIFHPSLIEKKIIFFRFLDSLETTFSGGVLAFSGCILQKILRNPICDPFLLGISSGGMFFGALFFIILLPVNFLIHQDFIPIHSLYIFFGCLISFVILFFLKKKVKNADDTYTYPLIGIILNAFFSALFMILTVFTTPSQLTQMHYWFLGNLQENSFPQIIFLIGLSLPSVLFLYSKKKEMKYITLGDPFTNSLGISPSRLRFFIVLNISILTAIMISFVGAIGFIGALIPHLFRKIGIVSYGKELTYNLIFGATFLNFSHFILNYFFSTTSLPLGVIVVILCSPLLVLLLIKNSKQSQHYA